MKLTGFISNKSPAHFRNDCTVRAVATVTGKDYVEIMLVFAEAGRKANRGFHIYDWLKSNGHTAFGCWFEKAMLSPRGTFLVGNQGHIWAIVNGVLYDSIESNRRFKYCYRVHKLNDSEAAPTKHEQRASAIVKALLAD